MDFGDIGTKEAGGGDVGEQDRVFVGDLVRQPDHPDVRERDASSLGPESLVRPGLLWPAEARGRKEPREAQIGRGVSAEVGGVVSADAGVVSVEGGAGGAGG